MLAKKDDFSRQIKAFIRNVFGFRVRNVELYKIALVHRSLPQQNVVAGKVNNERLEYLGDAVLGTITADYLFHRYPLQSEGMLTEMRSKIVCRENLNALSRKIGLSQLVLIDSHVHARSADGNAFEAIMGAIYLDLGYERTKDIFIKRILQMQLDLDSLFAEEKNFKSKVLAWTQKHHYTLEYTHVEVENRPNKLYKAVVILNGEAKAEGLGFTVKQAEQAAAQAFCEIIDFTA